MGKREAERRLGVDSMLAMAVRHCSARSDRPQSAKPFDGIGEGGPAADFLADELCLLRVEVEFVDETACSDLALRTKTGLRVPALGIDDAVEIMVGKLVSGGTQRTPQAALPVDHRPENVESE
jgi:hypothetical protein